MSQENLMEVFKFNQQDLAANRQGRMSAEQQERWAAAGQWSQAVLQKSISILAGIVILTIGLIATISTEQYLLGSVATLAAAGLVSGGFWLSAGRESQKETETIPTINRAEGPIKLIKNLQRGNTELLQRFEIEIEHHTLQLFTEEQFTSLENGGEYIVYFMDGENQYIVSLEKLS